MTSEDFHLPALCSEYSINSSCPHYSSYVMQAECCSVCISFCKRFTNHVLLAGYLGPEPCFSVPLVLCSLALIIPRTGTSNHACAALAISGSKIPCHLNENPVGRSLSEADNRWIPGRLRALEARGRRGEDLRSSNWSPLGFAADALPEQGHLHKVRTESEF